MKRLLFIAMISACLSVVSAFGQEASGISKGNLSQAEIDRIVRQFTKNEALFRQALNVYAFNRYASISTIGMGGYITGTYRRDSYLTFSGDGERFEKILFAPISTLKDIQITAADIDNLGGIDPFAIEPKVADQYQFTYLGKETIDEVNVHVFDVAPKVMPDWKKGIAKYFQGRVWVEDEGLMIVKSKGKAVPEGKERFPVVETTRAPVDGKYYFPIDSRSDDELIFDNGFAVKMRLRVRYTDYRVGRSDVKIIGEEDAPEPAKPVEKKP